MSELDNHDHQIIMKQLSRAQEISALDKDVTLIHQRLEEMKEDKEKATAWAMRLVGIFATLTLAVAGSAINSFSTINVLKEKVAEQKQEIQSVRKYSEELEDWADYTFERKEN